MDTSGSMYHTAAFVIPCLDFEHHAYDRTHGVAVKGQNVWRTPSLHDRIFERVI